MESRASSTVTLVALRYLRRHFHCGVSGYPLGTRNSSSAATAAAIRRQARGEYCFFEVGIPQIENAEKSSVVESNAKLRNLSLSKLRGGHEWINTVVHEGEIYREMKETVSGRGPFIIPRHYRQRSATEDGFCSKYFHWKRCDQLSHSLDPRVHLPTEAVGPGALEATRRVGDVQNVTTVSRSEGGSHLLSFWPLSILDQEPRTMMVTVPLEASSVKKKRKKKMNKHKQRKLRRRDRHRN